MIAKAPAENIDAAGMRGVVVDADPQTNRVMFGQPQLGQRHR